LSQQPPSLSFMDGDGKEEVDRTVQKIVWEEQPLPDPECVIHDASCQGSIGVALQQALCNEGTGDHNRDDGHAHLSEKKIKLDRPAIDRILQSFGRAVARTQHEQREILMKRTTQPQATSSAPAPCALLHGRVDHFNRRGGKWRLMVHDAKIIARKPLDRNRRKRERRPLWNAMEEGQPEPFKIARLEVLAYNDIE